jgi:hypothetical protein
LLGSRPAFNPNGSVSPLNPVDLAGPEFADQTGHRPAGRVEHSHTAGVIEQDQAFPGSLGRSRGDFENLFRPPQESVHEMLIGQTIGYESRINYLPTFFGRLLGAEWQRGDLS